MFLQPIAGVSFITRPEMLRNGGVQAKAYVVEDDSILFTEEDGKSFEVSTIDHTFYTFTH